MKTSPWTGLSVVPRSANGRAVSPAGEKFGPVVMEDFDLFLAIDGRAEIDLLGRRIAFTRGQVVLIPPRTPVMMTSTATSPRLMVYFHFDLSWRGKVVRDPRPWLDASNMALRFPGLEEISLTGWMEPEPVSSAILGFQHLLHDPAHPAQLAARSLLLNVLARLVGRDVDRRGRDHLERLVLMMGQHLDADLTMHELKKASGLSPATINRIFRRHTGQSAMRYFQRMRTARSRELLREGRLSIKEVAFACGFRSPQYFSRAFKRDTGRSPRDWLGGA
jgi:AraC-like DNA-binding protein